MRTLTLWTCAAALVLVLACDENETPDPQSGGTATAEETPAPTEETAETEAPAEEAAPTPEEIPIAEDFADEAEQAVTADNYAAELDRIAGEVDRELEAGGEAASP